MKHYNVIIIGAGPSGLMCAIEAGKRGRNVLIIDHADKIGKKLAISGGGRCNFTNRNVTADYYLSENPRFAISALKRYRPSDFIALLQKHNIRYHEEDHGQLFCDNSAKDILAMLLKECEEAGVTIHRGCNILKVGEKKVFQIETDLGSYTADSLVIATGGLSYSKTGATPLGYGIARQFGLKVIKTDPGLVPLHYSNDDMKRFKSLAGITIKAEVSLGKQSFRENILFTHKGLSGPSILQISNYWGKGKEIEINVLPELDLLQYLTDQKLKHPKKLLKTILTWILPRRFIDVTASLWFNNRPIGEIPDKELKNISSKYSQWKFKPACSAGYDFAEVTLGGVDTRELSSKTMESTKIKGLFFLGEVLDMTGHLGGYNLQWAWASGYAAGQYV
ncbi:MAG: NAD(P)/FAD-dependent oxidoreductase [Proteobacteria bacterium]|nr:NAD(P)/FAD-dependent oxidoreductase [Pseudomonadota bacterium]